MDIKRLNHTDIELTEKAVRCLKLDSEINDFDKDSLSRFLSNPKNYFIIALQNNKPVGFTTCYELERVDCANTMMLLYEIFVMPEHRKKGFAKAMVDFLKGLCKNNKALKMWGITNLSNKPAVNLFKNTGAQIIQEDDSILFTYR